MASIQNIYLFVKKEAVHDCIKYGMKLSNFSDVSVRTRLGFKKGMVAFFSPNDSTKVEDNNYEALRISCNNLNVYVNSEGSSICKLEKYTLGSSKNPQIIIMSSILPENIFKYNSILDVPLLISSSQDLYDLVKEEERLEKLSENLSFDSIKNKKKSE